VALDGPASIGVPWPFRPLRSRERARVEVTTAGTDGGRAEAATVLVEAPLLDPGDWTARWIARPASATDERPARFRHRFEARSPVRARLHVTARGVYEAELNGTRVGDEVLAPGWTSYDDRLLYQTHDVTDLLSDGANTLVIWSAGGWFTERYGHFGHAQRWYEGPTAVLAQLELTYADGRREVVATSPEWEVGVDGPLVASGIYGGEEFDATREETRAPARVIELPTA
jgi:alpha-L-rhamnosidase